ncbi:MAG: hypothetical protein GQ529_03110 [Methyloprofundus sp.]|nr:hypothetical protein [Methyloprofundus sp.]
MGVANDGMSPGGNIALLVYESMLSEQGMPTVLREDALDDVLTNSYYAKQRPLWGKLEAGELAPDYLRIILFGLLVGLTIGLTLFVIRGLNKVAS